MFWFGSVWFADRSTDFMLKEAKERPDLWLLLSILCVIMLYPALDHGTFRRLIMGAVMFLPIIVATIRLSKLKGWLWPSVGLMLASVVLTGLGMFIQAAALLGAKWFVLAAFFAVTAAALFSYLRTATSISSDHLYTAVSIYLLIGIIWFAMYNAIDILTPGSIVRNSSVMTDRSTELLYFSLITLSTVGYGDVVPVNPEVRMLAALEGIIGVLYVAIMVALLVSSYKRPIDV